jgi:hypothetical protein
MKKLAFILLLFVSGCATPKLSAEKEQQCIVESVTLADTCWRNNPHMTFDTCLILANQATGSCYVVVGSIE